MCVFGLHVCVVSEKGLFCPSVKVNGEGEFIHVWCVNGIVPWGGRNSGVIHACGRKLGHV